MSQCDTCAIAKHKCSQRPGAGPNSTCERCHERHLTCKRESDRYRAVLASRLAAGRKAAELAERCEAAPPVRRARRARPSPANAKAGPSSQRLSPEFHNLWDTRFDTPDPTFDVLLGVSIRLVPRCSGAASFLALRDLRSRLIATKSLHARC